MGEIYTGMLQQWASVKNYRVLRTSSEKTQRYSLLIYSLCSFVNSPVLFALRLR